MPSYHLSGCILLARIAFLAPRRVNQEPGNLALLVGLKRDAKRQFRSEKVLEAFRPEAQFRKSPIGWQLYCQGRSFACDDERLAPGGIPASVAVKDRSTWFESTTTPTRFFASQTIELANPNVPPSCTINWSSPLPVIIQPSACSPPEARRRVLNIATIARVSGEGS